MEIKWHALRPKLSSPCLISKKTLLVILGPFAASTDWAQKNAATETTTNASESRPIMVG
jgi:hypothetical protein